MLGGGVRRPRLRHVGVLCPAVQPVGDGLAPGVARIKGWTRRIVLSARGVCQYSTCPRDGGGSREALLPRHPKSAGTSLSLTHTHTRARARTCTHMHTHTQPCTHARTRTHTQRTHTQTNTHTCTHTHTHTHVQHVIRNMAWMPCCTCVEQVLFTPLYWHLGSWRNHRMLIFHRPTMHFRD